MEVNQKRPVVSMQALRRMPYYLSYLKELSLRGEKTISAPVVAKNFDYTEIQVRKDFATVCSSAGRPKAGFVVEDLIDAIETLLGYRNTKEAVLVGVGALGRAFLHYSGFEEYGVKTIAGFDCDELLWGERVADKPIFPSNRISELTRRMQVHIGIITVPSSQAQIVCDQLVAGGVRGILNFAGVHLSVGEDVLVQNENLAASLALLSKHLNEVLNAK